MGISRGMAAEDRQFGRLRRRDRGGRTVAAQGARGRSSQERVAQAAVSASARRAGSDRDSMQVGPADGPHQLRRYRLR